MNGSQLQNSLTKGRVVSGVATDGVAQLVVRIDTNSPGEQFTVTLLNDQTPQHQQSSLPNEDGALDFPGSTTLAQSQLTVSAGNVSSDGLAHGFAVYRAPIDFARPTGAGFKTGFCAGFPPSFNTANTDDNLQCRSVYIRVQDPTNLARTITVPVIILRDRLWSHSGNWRSDLQWYDRDRDRLEYDEHHDHGTIRSDDRACGGLRERRE